MPSGGRGVCEEVGVYVRRWRCVWGRGYVRGGGDMCEEVGVCEGGNGGGGRESVEVNGLAMDYWNNNSVVQPTNIGSAPSNLKILLKCVSGDAELLKKIQNFVRGYIHSFTAVHAISLFGFNHSGSGLLHTSRQHTQCVVASGTIKLGNRAVFKLTITYTSTCTYWLELSQYSNMEQYDIVQYNSIHLLRHTNILHRAISYCSILRVLCEPELDHWNVNVDKLLFLCENLKQLTFL